MLLLLLLDLFRRRWLILVCIRIGIGFRIDIRNRIRGFAIAGFLGCGFIGFRGFRPGKTEVASDSINDLIYAAGAVIFVVKGVG